MKYRSAKTGCRIRARSGLRCAAGVLLILTAGCEPWGKPNPANRPITPDQVLDFNALYSTHCAACHGANGEMGPAPPLNDPIFAVIVSEEALQQVIREGRAGTPMPPALRANGGSLTDAQVNVLAKGIKTHWQPQAWLEKTPPEYALTKDEISQFAHENRERGAELFERACAACHGTNGSGGEEVGAINLPAFLGLISDQALRRIIITGRPDLGMPNYADQTGRESDFKPLTSAQINDLVALLANWRETKTVAQTGH